MTEQSAIDTNVLVYSRNTDDDFKYRRAQTLLDLSPVASSQVISEYMNFLRRSFNYTKREIMEICLTDFNNCIIHPVSYSTLEYACTLINRYDFQMFDSIIVASALEAGCKTLYSEDMQHGMIVEKSLRIINPFV